MRQREAAVEFGRLALRSDRLDEILNEACRLTAEAMGTEFSKVMQLINDGTELLVVAGVGWRDGIVGEERIPAKVTSSEGFVVATGFPAVSEDIHEEDRFDYADFLKQHGVEAIVNVIIPGAQGNPPFGLLQVDSQEPREFSKDDVQFLQGYANVLGAAIDRHRFQSELADALEERERLYAELQHRINNTLMMIASLLRIRADHSRHPAVKQEVAAILSQVDILTDVYRKLHAVGGTEEVELGGYLGSLFSSVVSINNGRSIHLENSSDHALVSSRLAVSLGLIANEFVTNSLKHSPSDKKLTLSLQVERTPEDLVVTMSDSGPGFRRDAVNGNGNHSGLILIESLLDQIGAKYDWATEKGTRLTFTMPVATNVIGLAH